MTDLLNVVIKCAGVTGETGPQGDTGLQGDRGYNGSTGNTIIMATVCLALSTLFQKS